jgi:ribosomal protein S27AE
MHESIRSYLRRRYRWTLSGVVGGALGALLAGSAIAGRGPEVAFQGACAIVWGGALVVAAATRCPRCRARIASGAGQVIPLLVQFSLGTPPKRCPRCGVSLDEPGPPSA